MGDEQHAVEERNFGSTLASLDWRVGFNVVGKRALSNTFFRTSNDLILHA